MRLDRLILVKNNRWNKENVYPEAQSIKVVTVSQTVTKTALNGKMDCRVESSTHFMCGCFQSQSFIIVNSVFVIRLRKNCFQ